VSLSWSDYLRLYAPFIAYGMVLALVAVVGGLYAAGYRSGVKSILDVSARSQKEARFNARP
jgi:hypothetical protein